MKNWKNHIVEVQREELESDDSKKQKTMSD